MEKWFFRTSKRVEDGGLKLHIHTGFPLVAGNRPTTELTNTIKERPERKPFTLPEAPTPRPPQQATASPLRRTGT